MYNKKWSLLASLSYLIFLTSTYSFAQNNERPNFKASFSIKDSRNQKILLTNKPASGTQASFKVEILDSCTNVNDTFSFEFYVKEPAWYSIEFEGVKGWQSFIATPNGHISISGSSDSLYKSSIKGSKEDSLYNELVENIIKPMYKKMYSASPDSFKNIYPEMINQAKYNFITQNPNSFISAWYLVEAESYINNTDTARLHFVQKCYLALSDEAKEFSSSKNAYYKLFEGDKILSPGNIIPNFEIVDYTNTTFNLYNYLDENKRKYYFIDFWAVWCKPCIAQFPKLTKIYHEFNHLGLGLLGFSFDVNKDKYQEFTDKNSLNWLNITDLKGGESEVYKLFNISSLPANLLIDADKNIVDVNITPDKLLQFLEEKISD